MKNNLRALTSYFRISWVTLLILTMVCQCFWIGALSAQVSGANENPNTLTWEKSTQTISASIDGENLDSALSRLSAATGWKIRVEPGLNLQIQTRFKNLPIQKALRFLLPDLSYAMLPKPGMAPELLVFRSSSSAATQEVNALNEEGSEDSVPGEVGDEWVVVMKADSKADIDEIAASLGAKVVGSIDDLGVYRLKFESEEARDAAESALKGDPRVEEIEPNFIASPLPSPQLYGAASPYAGLGIKLQPGGSEANDYLTVALVDTSVTSVTPEFDAFLLPQKSVFQDSDSAANTGSDSNPDSSGQTGLDHGSITGYALLEAASQQADLNRAADLPMRIQPINVFQPNQPDTTSFDVAMGLKMAIESGAMIVNASLGGYGASAAQDIVIKQGAALGVSFYFAAGNEPTQLPTYPAANPNGVAVSALTSSGEIASYANYGSFVDVLAPDYAWTPVGSQTYITRGTSVSSAIMAGIAAGLSVSTGKSPQVIEQELRVQYAPPATNDNP